MSYVLEDSRKSNVDIAAFSGEKISKILLLTDYENMHDFSDHRDVYTHHHENRRNTLVNHIKTYLGPRANAEVDPRDGEAAT